MINLYCKLRGHLPPMKYLIDSLNMYNKGFRCKDQFNYYCVRCGKRIDFSYLFEEVKR